MKKMTIAMILLFGVGFLISYSCTKEDGDDDGGGGNNNPTKKTMLTERKDFQSIDTSYRAYSYNADQNIERETWKDKNDVVQKVILYQYDASKRLIGFKTYQDAAMTTLISVANYTLNSTGQVVTSVEDNTGAITTNTYTYNSGKMITALTEYSGSAAGLDFEVHYDWTNDNVSKTTHMVEDTAGTGGFITDSYVELEYDNKINPYQKMGITNGNPDYMSVNNVTKVETYDANGIIQQLFKFTYQYNGDYPLSCIYDYSFISGQWNFTFSEI